MKTIQGALCAAMLTGASGSAIAATATDTFNVTATVLSACSVIADDLDFGDYNPLTSSVIPVVGNIGVTCTLGTVYDILLSAGGTTGATVSTRQMRKVGEATPTDDQKLSYVLARTALITDIWGITPTAVTGDILSGVGLGVETDYPLYGFLPAAQNPEPGDYLDTVTVTIDY